MTHLFSYADYTQGRARLISQNLPNPAVGTELSLVVPGGRVWIVHSLRASLVTSAVVANRTVTLIVQQGTDGPIVAQLQAVAVHAATATRGYSWVAGQTSLPSAFQANQISYPIPAVTLMAGMRLATLTNLLDGGDQWSGIGFLATECEAYSAEVRYSTNHDVLAPIDSRYDEHLYPDPTR